MNAAKAAELAVRAVAVFAGAMPVGTGAISLLGPATRGLALERPNTSAAE